MTEAEWNTRADPGRMLEQVWPRATERKLRLFACACLRRAGHLLTDERAWQAVTAAEAVVDSTERGSKWREVIEAPGNDWRGQANGAVGRLLAAHAFDAATGVVAALAGAGLPPAERGHQAALLRCLFGNPFRSMPPLSTHWFVWGEGTAWSLADEIYASGHFDQVGILGDALEEAGCTRADLLAHCRLPGGHARGCWAVDLLLGKS
jgi:hypothetical protein